MKAILMTNITPVAPEKPEFSRVFILDKVGRKPVTYTISPTAEEREALRQRLQLVELRTLSADFIIERQEAERAFDVRGTVTTHVVQSCVVTLTDIPQDLTIPIHLLLREEIPDHVEPEDHEDLLTCDIDIEDLEGANQFDFGEVTAQYIALSLDPYPRVLAFDKEEPASTTDQKPSPFAQLKDLLPKKN